jgi:hypothetical protein
MRKKMVGFDVNGTWHDIPAPRRKRLMWYAVLNLILIASMALLPITFNFVQIYHIYPIRYNEPIGWFADWLWGSLRLTGEYMSPLDEAVLQEPYLLVLGIIYLFINALFFLGIWLATPYSKIFTSRFYTGSTIFWAILFTAISLAVRRVPGPPIILLHIVVVVMLKMYRPLESTPAEEMELADWFEKIVPQIGEYLETKDIVGLRVQLREFNHKASIRGSSNYVYEADRYLACLPDLEILYNEVFHSDVLSLDYLKTKFTFREWAFNMLIMGITSVFKATISGGLVTFERPIDQTMFIRTVRLVLDDIRAESISRAANNYQRSMAFRAHG